MCTDADIKMDECTIQRYVNQHWLLPCLEQNGNISAQGMGPMAEQILMNLGNTNLANHHLSIQPLVVTFMIHFGKSRKPSMFMVFGLVGRAHDSYLSLETPEYSK